MQTTGTPGPLAVVHKRLDDLEACNATTRRALADGIFQNYPAI